MRTTREILRLNFEHGLSFRAIGRIFDVSHNTVSYIVRAARIAQLTWKEIEQLDDAQLEAKLRSKKTNRTSSKPMPDYSMVHAEMQRRNMTLTLLWEEYRLKNSNGYGYSQFCEGYRQYTRTVNVSMRQVHRAGEKMFVDFSGSRPTITNPKTGERRPVELFVAVLGASNYTYVEAIVSQTIPDWLAANGRALRFFGGAPQMIVPDNLKSAVTKPDRYEPEIQLHYQQFGAHYETAIVPARVRRPKDKSKVEGAVLFVHRWISLALRHQTFFSLNELNEAIQYLLRKLNEKPFKKLPGCRRSRYEEIDRPSLKPLPVQDYEYSVIKRVLVGPDYHVEHGRHYYSVPYTLVGKVIEIRVTEKVIEILYKGKRVGNHKLTNLIGEKSTLLEHMPSKHLHYQQWTAEKLIDWAQKVGDGASKFVNYQLHERGHPQNALQTCVGVMHLGKKYSDERIERACLRAIAIGSMTYKSIKSILQSGSDALPLPSSEKVVNRSVPLHENVRGAAYYC